MSRWLPEWRQRSRATLVLDAQGFACAAIGGVRAGSFEELPDALASIGARRFDVVVASDVAVHWVQAVPRSLQSLAELRQVALARCVHLFGGDVAHWWIAGDWDLRGAFLCAGLPQAFVARAEQSLGAIRASARWNSVLGFMLERHAHLSHDDGWNALLSACTVLVWHTTARRIDSVATLRVARDEGSARLEARVQQHVALEHMRHGFAPDQEVRWLDVSVTS